MKSKKHILLISCFYYPSIGGIQKDTRTLAEQFVSKGHSATVLTYWHNRSISQNDTHNGVDIYRYKNSFDFIRYLIVNRKTFDGILAFQFFAKSFYVGVLKFLKILKIPTMVCTTSGGENDEINILRRLYKFGLYKIYFFFVTRHTYLNCYNEDNIRNLRTTYWNASIEKKMVKIYCSINMAGAIKEKKSQIKNILFLSRLVEAKGPNLTIKAFREISDPDLRLHIVGRSYPENLAILQELAQSDPRIKIHPDATSQQKDQLLKEADLFVFPTFYPDGFGIVLIEAAKYNIPIITTDYADVKLIFGDNIKYVEKESLQDLRETILWMRDNIGDFNYDYSQIQQDFDHSNIADQYLSELFKEDLDS